MSACIQNLKFASELSFDKDKYTYTLSHYGQDVCCGSKNNETRVVTSL